MDGGMGFLNRTEPNRKKDRSEPREPKPNQNPSENPKRTETKRGFTGLFVKRPLRSHVPTRTEIDRSHEGDSDNEDRSCLACTCTPKQP